MNNNHDLLHKALQEFGTAEKPGAESNPRVLHYAKTVGLDWFKDDSKTSWCSIFMSFVAKECGYTLPDKPALARAWLKMGSVLEKPHMGCVTILWRRDPKSWMGHVGIFVREDSTHIWLLGGNQRNQVRIQAYPKSRVLGYRILGK